MPLTDPLILADAIRKNVRKQTQFLPWRNSIKNKLCMAFVFFFIAETPDKVKFWKARIDSKKILISQIFHPHLKHWWQGLVFFRKQWPPLAVIFCTSVNTFSGLCTPRLKGSPQQHYLPWYNYVKTPLICQFGVVHNLSLCCNFVK